MDAKPSSLLIFQPCLNLYFKPFIFSSSSLALNIILRFSFPKPSFFANLTFHYSLSALSSAQSFGHGDTGGRRSGVLSLTPVTEELQKIDVNPPKGTRDFHRKICYSATGYSIISERFRIPLLRIVDMFVIFVSLRFSRFRECTGSRRLIFRCSSRRRCSLGKQVNKQETRDTRRWW